MKIGVLCSHSFAFLSIERLSDKGVLAGLGAPQKEEFTPALKAMANHTFVPMSIIEDDNGKSLKAWLDLVMPDVVFVLGFPYKIAEQLLSVPSMGFYNFHIGLLPDYRGIDPVFWQIRNGERFGGLTVHMMDGGFDSGPIAHQEKIEIFPYETYGLHLQRLSLTAGESVSQMVEKLSNGEPELVKQEEPERQYPSRPGFEDLMIRWESQPAKSIKALVQASNPSYGGAITYYNGTMLRITEASVHRIQTPAGSKPGTIVSIDNGLFVLCADGKSLGTDIIFNDAGLFSGKQFIHAFDVKKGEQFSETEFPNLNGKQDTSNRS